MSSDPHFLNGGVYLHLLDETVESILTIIIENYDRHYENTVTFQ